MYVVGPIVLTVTQSSFVEEGIRFYNALPIKMREEPSRNFNKAVKDLFLRDVSMMLMSFSIVLHSSLVIDSRNVSALKPKLGCNSFILHLSYKVDQAKRTGNAKNR